jgi:MYXO-CTERM domain-containing protein
MNTKIQAVALAAFSVVASASADIGVVEATGAFTFPGSGSPSYISATGAGQNPRLNGYDFGSINVLTGQSLLLGNWYFENYAYNGGSTPAGAATNNNWLDGANVAALVVTVKSGSTVVSSNTYSLYQTGNSGSNRFWQLAVASQGANLVSGLSNGSYTVEFTNTFNFNQWTGFVSQVNATTGTSTASFTVTPAPGALALLGVTGIVGARRRR